VLVVDLQKAAGEYVLRSGCPRSRRPKRALAKSKDSATPLSSNRKCSEQAIWPDEEGGDCLAWEFLEDGMPRLLPLAFHCLHVPLAESFKTRRHVVRISSWVITEMSILGNKFP
jgi:hypothetical protein